MYDSLPNYQTYILKFWQERTESNTPQKVVRFSLEDTATNVRYGFRTLDEMVVFLKQQSGDV